VGTANARIKTNDARGYKQDDKPQSVASVKKEGPPAINTQSKEEIHAAHARTTRRMELERISGAIYGTTPGFRKHAHTEGMAGLYGNLTLTRSLIPNIAAPLTPSSLLA